MLLLLPVCNHLARLLGSSVDASQLGLGRCNCELKFSRAVASHRGLFAANQYSNQGEVNLLLGPFGKAFSRINTSDAHLGFLSASFVADVLELHKPSCISLAVMVVASIPEKSKYQYHKNFGFPYREILICFEPSTPHLRIWTLRDCIVPVCGC